jgi:tetratricopeptide (TPR) repeat protein
MKSGTVLLALMIVLKTGAAEAGSADDCALTTNPIAAFQSCTRIIESGDIGPELRAKALLNRGNALQNRGDLARAIDDYNEAKGLDPKFALAFNNRGVALRVEGNLARAIADFDEAIRLEPRFALAYYNRGLAHLTLGDVGRAIADYDEAIRLAPQFKDGFYNRRCDGGPAIRQIADAEFDTD